MGFKPCDFRLTSSRSGCGPREELPGACGHRGGEQGRRGSSREAEKEPGRKKETVPEGGSDWLWQTLLRRSRWI